MSKIRTISQLQEALDAEIVWRIKEISAFRIAAKANGVNQKTFVRAGVALMYAHWEGFIKTASKNYLSYVCNQGHSYRDLKTCFAVFGLKLSLALLTDSRKSKPSIEAFEFVLGEMDKTARMSMASAIDTESNLTSKIFANIAASIDISTTRYETKFNMIDESLVRRRNKVAHGEYLDLGLAEFLTLAENIVQVMRDYKTDLENAATLKAYKRPEAVPGTQAAVVP